MLCRLNPPINYRKIYDANLNRYSCTKGFAKSKRFRPFALLSFAENPLTLSVWHWKSTDYKCRWQQLLRHVANHCARLCRFKMASDYPVICGLVHMEWNTLDQLWRELSQASDHDNAWEHYMVSGVRFELTPTYVDQNLSLQTTLPLTAEQPSPCVPDPAVVEERDRNIKEYQTRNYDNRYNTRPLPTLDAHVQDPVFFPDRRENGEIMSCSNRSYVWLRRLRVRTVETDALSINPLPSETTTRIGRVSRPPTRMDCWHLHYSFHTSITDFYFCFLLFYLSLILSQCFLYCKRRNFRREFNFVAFVYLKKVRN